MASALKLAALIAASLYACSAQADVRTWPETKAMLAAPDQPPAVYAFVNRAIEEDRLSEAANALERLMRFRPALTQARFDLVKLYEAMDQGDLADEQRQALAEAGATDTFQANTEITGFFGAGCGL